MRKNTGEELWGMDEFRGGHSTASHMCDAAVGRCISCLFLLRSLSVFSLYSLCSLSVSRARARSLSLIPVRPTLWLRLIRRPPHHQSRSVRQKDRCRIGVTTGRARGKM